MLQRNRSWKVLNFCHKIYNDGFVQETNTDGPQIASVKGPIILRILFMYNYLIFFNTCWKLNPNLLFRFYFLSYNLQIISNFEAIASIMCLQKHQNRCRISLSASNIIHLMPYVLNERRKCCISWITPKVARVLKFFTGKTNG
jgi:hypothetical protein